MKHIYLSILTLVFIQVANAQVFRIDTNSVHLNASSVDRVFNVKI